MKTTKFKQITVAVTLAAFALVMFAPAPAQAGWDDQSDELPGMDNNWGTYALVAAGVVAVIGTIALIKKGSDNSDTTEKPADQEPLNADGVEEAEGDKAGSDAAASGSVSFDAEAYAPSRFDLYVGLDQAGGSHVSDGSLKLSDLGVKVGVSVSF